MDAEPSPNQEPLTLKDLSIYPSISLIEELRRRSDFGIVITGKTTAPTFMDSDGQLQFGSTNYINRCWGGDRDLAAVSKALATYFENNMMGHLFSLCEEPEQIVDVEDELDDDPEGVVE